MTEAERKSYSVADKDINPDFRGVLDGITIKQGLELDGYNQIVDLSSSKPFQVSIYTEKRCDAKSSRELIFSRLYKNLILSLGEYGSHFQIDGKDGLSLKLEQEHIGQETIRIKSNKVYVSSRLTGPGSANFTNDLEVKINAAIFHSNLSTDTRYLKISDGTKYFNIKLPNIKDDLDISNYCSNKNKNKIPNSFEYDTAHLYIKNASNNSLIKIKRPGAVIIRKNIPISDLQGKALGISSFLAVSATNSTGQLGGEKFTTGDTPTEIWLKGRINLRWNDNGGITAEGISDAAWFNGKMGSQTKWDSLGDEWQRWAIGGTIAALIFAARLVLKVFWSIRLKRVIIQ